MTFQGRPTVYRGRNGIVQHPTPDANPCHRNWEQLPSSTGCSFLTNLRKTRSAGGIGGSDGLSWLPVESPHRGSHMGGYWQLSAPCLTKDQKDHRHHWMTSPHLAFLPARSTHTDSQFHSEESQFEWVTPEHLARTSNLVDACKGL
jgi:hypothetical protein